MKKIIIFTIFLLSLIFATNVQAKELQFAQFSDIHLSLDESNGRGVASAEIAENMKLAIKEINKNRDIKFVVFTGDNIDKAEREALIQFFKLANKLHKPYYVVIGNHEVFRYKRFDKKDYMHTVWWKHWQMLGKKPSYVFKPKKELVFIVVDGANELMPSPSGYFKPETLEWLDKKLKKYKNKKVVLVQHFPLVPPVKKKSHDTVDADKYFQVINSYDNVIAIVSGHFHANNFIYRKGIYHLSAPAFLEKPHEYKIIKIEYEPKYLFSSPAEFSISQELVPTIKDYNPDAENDAISEQNENAETQDSQNDISIMEEKN